MAEEAAAREAAAARDAEVAREAAEREAREREAAAAAAKAAEAAVQEAAAMEAAEKEKAAKEKAAEEQAAAAEAAKKAEAEAKAQAEAKAVEVAKARDEAKAAKEAKAQAEASKEAELVGSDVTYPSDWLQKAKEAAAATAAEMAAATGDWLAEAKKAADATTSAAASSTSVTPAAADAIEGSSQDGVTPLAGGGDQPRDQARYERIVSTVEGGSSILPSAAEWLTESQLAALARRINGLTPERTDLHRELAGDLDLGRVRTRLLEGELDAEDVTRLTEVVLDGRLRLLVAPVQDADLDQMRDSIAAVATSPARMLATLLCEADAIVARTEQLMERKRRQSQQQQETEKAPIVISSNQRIGGEEGLCGGSRTCCTSRAALPRPERRLQDALWTLLVTPTRGGGGQARLLT